MVLLCALLLLESSLDQVESLQHLFLFFFFFNVHIVTLILLASLLLAVEGACFSDGNSGFLIFYFCFSFIVMRSSTANKPSAEILIAFSLLQ